VLPPEHGPLPDPVEQPRKGLGVAGGEVSAEEDAQVAQGLLRRREPHTRRPTHARSKVQLWVGPKAQPFALAMIEPGT
jgi:hypothetical protein